MPYPSQIDRDRIIETARQLIEARGIDRVTLRGVADELGVKAPSLYRYVKNKNAMLLAINEVTIRELIEGVMQASDHSAPIFDRLVSIALAYRKYAHAHPVCYALSMSNNPEIKPGEEALLKLILPLQALFAQLTDESDSLSALRGAYAFLHGWVCLENGEQLRRGGDLDAHFEQSFRAYLTGWLG